MNGYYYYILFGFRVKAMGGRTMSVLNARNTNVLGMKKPENAHGNTEYRYIGNGRRSVRLPVIIHLRSTAASFVSNCHDRRVLRRPGHSHPARNVSFFDPGKSFMPYDGAIEQRYLFCNVPASKRLTLFGRWTGNDFVLSFPFRCRVSWENV